MKRRWSSIRIYRGAQHALAILTDSTDDTAEDQATAAPSFAHELEPESELITPLADRAAPAVQPQSDDPESNASMGVGDRILAGMTKMGGPDNPMSLAAKTNGRFEQWLSTADTDAIASTMMMVSILVFQYAIKDRNIASWTFWVDREVQLAEALPHDFGPAESRSGMGRHRYLSDALQSLGEVRVNQGKLPEARILFERSLDLLDQEQQARTAAGLSGESEFDRLFTTTSLRGNRLNSLINVCTRLGDIGAAAVYRGTLADHDELPTPEAEMQSNIATAAFFESRGEVNRSLGYYQHALHIAEDKDPDPLVPRMVTTALNALGLAHQRLGLLRSALGYFDRARKLNERTGNSHRLAYDHQAIADVLKARPSLSGDGLGDARHHLEQALIYCSSPAETDGSLTWTASTGTRYRISAPDRAWPILLDFGRPLRDAGDDIGAARFLTLATHLADAVRAGVAEDHQRIALQTQQIEAFAELTLAYARLATGGLPDAAEHARDAWTANEAMRARTFLDALGDAHLTAPAEVPAELTAHEADLLEQRRLLRQSGGSDLGFWERFREITSDLESVWARMRSEAPTAEGYVEVRQALPAEPSDISTKSAADPWCWRAWSPWMRNASA